MDVSTWKTILSVLSCSSLSFFKSTELDKGAELNEPALVCCRLHRKSLVPKTLPHLQKCNLQSKPCPALVVGAHKSGQDKKRELQIANSTFSCQLGSLKLQYFKLNISRRLIRQWCTIVNKHNSTMRMRTMDLRFLITSLPASAK